VLPRATDVVADTLRHRAAHRHYDNTEWLILDFVSAFFLVPLHPSERRYYVIKFRNKYYVFLVTVQGGRSSPLVWGRVAALVGRLTQGMFHPLELLMQIYVDDPCATISGTRAERDLITAVVIFVWRCLGFPLSFAKGQRGRKVTWIGCTLSVSWDVVIASIKPETLAELEQQIGQLMSSNVCSIKDVSSATGRASHVASLVWAWRPFLQFLWAALHQSPGGNCPPGCVWLKQIIGSLIWLAAFLKGTAGTVSREFWVDTYLNRGTQFELVLDASPWGLGGLLVRDGTIVAFFTSPLTEHDVRIMGWPIGDCSGQQTWEALAALVALRLWHDTWYQDRVQLRITGDSVCMLTLVIQMRAPARSPALGIIARELALDVAHAVYQPDIVAHVPGIANKLPDMLSRRHEPGYTWSTPAILSGAEAHVPPQRDEAYYSTLLPPGGCHSGGIGGTSSPSSSEFQ